MKDIREMPTVVDKTHESVFKSYHILKQVKKMLDRGDSVDTIKEVVEHLEACPIDENEKYIKMFTEYLIAEGYLVDGEKQSPLNIDALYGNWYS